MGKEWVGNCHKRNLTITPENRVPKATQNLEYQVGRMCVFVRLPGLAGMRTKYRDYIHFIMLCQASVALEARELQGNMKNSIGIS